MANSFSVDEIFEMAEQMERNGELFYRKGVEETADPELKSTFEELADMEKDHVKTFTDMRAALTGGRDYSYEFDPDDLTGMYLRDIVENRVFDVKNGPATKMTGYETPRDILNLAIDMEKDTIVFYVGMKSCMPDDKSREKVDELIKQEIGHIFLLKGKLKEL